MAKIAKLAANIILLLVSVIIGLKGADMLLHKASRLPGIGLENPQKSIVTLDLYPYDGWHVQPNFVHKGKMAWESDPNQEVTFATGDQGYLIDFPLASPPKKKPTNFALFGPAGAELRAGAPPRTPRRPPHNSNSC